MSADTSCLVAKIGAHFLLLPKFRFWAQVRARNLNADFLGKKGIS